MYPPAPGATTNSAAGGSLIGVSLLNPVAGGAVSIEGTVTIGANGAFAPGTGTAGAGTVTVNSGGVLNIGAGSGGYAGLDASTQDHHRCRGSTRMRTHNSKKRCASETRKTIIRDDECKRLADPLTVSNSAQGSQAVIDMGGRILEAELLEGHHHRAASSEL